MPRLPRPRALCGWPVRVLPPCRLCLEDEILKAFVMKYDKNQSAHISSLLVRKSIAT